MTIERFKGYQVPMGAFTGLPQGYYGLPGGGYRGLTDELDAIVMTAAERLTATYKRDVVIRFNSDRKGGGAWLKDVATTDTLIGLTAWLCEDDAIRQRIYVSAAARHDPRNPLYQPYALIEVASWDAAMDWLRGNATVPA